MKAQKLIFFVVLVFFASSCGLFNGEDAEIHTFENSGLLCLGVGNHHMSGSINADEPFEISISTAGCYSSSCSSLEKEECTIIIDDQGVLVVESLLEVRDTYGTAMACTDDCGNYTTRCSAPALEEGEYTLQHGESTLTFTVPSEEAPCEMPF